MVTDGREKNKSWKGDKCWVAILGRREREAFTKVAIFEQDLGEAREQEPRIMSITNP